jgi:membrane-bound metal-dependent hydrolase YbcI (DUF457 family)
MVFAVALYLSLAYFTPFLPVNIGALTLLAFASIAPDIDHDQSKITKWFNKIVFLGIGLFVFSFFTTNFTKFSPYGLAEAAVITVVAYLVAVAIMNWARPAHRGHVHSLIANAIFAAIIFGVTSGNLTLTAIAAIGFLFHLLGDLVYSGDLSVMKIW